MAMAKLPRVSYRISTHALVINFAANTLHIIHDVTITAMLQYYNHFHETMYYSAQILLHFQSLVTVLSYIK